MERKKLLIACGIIIALVAAGLATVLIALSNQRNALTPAPSDITVSGNLTCLRHNNVAEGAPTTLECAIGLRTANGDYALQDLPANAASTSFTASVTVTGDVVPAQADDRYETIGVITVKTFTAN